tara:strand:- start:2991 stop:5765 length:2775 start_codon:yes stop_codon:yes gene_type:complete
MINRRRPIQSIVAGRKMFSNSGVVPPPMGAPPMGILNSSPELAQAASFSQPPPTLVDSMVNEATAGYGQGLQDSTAVNAAPVPMAQGGLASEDMMAQGFFNGGVQYGTNPNRPPRPLGSPRISYRGQSVSDDDLGAAWASGEGRGVVRPVARNARVLPVFGPAIQAEEPAANAMIRQSNKFLNQAGPNTGNYTSLDAEEFLSPYKLDPSLDFDVQTFSATGDIKPMNLNALINEDKNDRGDRWFDVPLLNEPGRQSKEAPAAALIRQAAGAASAATKILARSLSSLWNAQFDGETADKYNAEGWGGKAFMVASMIESQPGFKEEIEALTTELITKNPKIRPTELKNAVAYALSNKYEIGPHAGAINKAGIKAEREGVIADLTSGESLTAEEYEKMKAAEAAELAESAALTEGETFSDLFYAPGGIDEEERVKAETDEAIDFLKYGVTDETEMPRDPTDAEAGELARIKEEEEARFREYGVTDETEMPRDPTDAEATELAEGDIAALTEGEEFATLTDELKAAENLALSRFGSKTNMKPAEAKRTLENYVDEFKKVAPEYEGMSDSEKWFAIAEAGLRIMAGQSPNAITNIAKGLKGLGSELSKDAKEKRAYDRQVGLSAAKYALTSTSKDREKMEAFERSERELAYIVNLKTRETKTVTKADLRAGNIPKGFTPTKDPTAAFIDSAKATASILKQEAALAGKGEITSKWTKLGENYTKASQSVLDSVQSKTLLGPAIQTLFAKNPDGSNKVPVTGIEGVMNSSWNRLRNAFGITNDDIVTKKGEARDAYLSRVKAVIAKKITAILGESNRTISTPDRTRADEIAGVFTGYFLDPATRDPDILRDKIRILWQTLDNDEKRGIATMNRIESEVGNLKVPGGSEYYRNVLRRGRRELLGTAVGIGPKGKVRKLSDFGYDIKSGTWKK